MSAAEGRAPNILFIVSDDQGYADLGFQGCKDIPTPSIDALAASGVHFTNGYVTAPYCSPSRAGLLTGRYQTRFGHEFNPKGNNGIPVTETTLANHLKDSGYATGAIGKWHLGNPPQTRGFVDFFGFLAGEHSYFDPARILRGTQPVTEMDYTTDAFGREACDFIEKNKQKPWFLYLAFNAVHTPMNATDDRLAKFSAIKDRQRRIYAAMSLALDEAVGKVRDKLTATGLAENTLVAYISDNGGPTMKGVTINGSRNDPFRGSKRTTLEGGIHVPFLLSWPARIKPSVYQKPVISLDLHATALAAAGITAKPEWKLEGVNLLPYIIDGKEDAPHESLYWRFGDQMAIRSGDWKLVVYDTNADTNVGNTKGKEVSEPKLYNLSTDIHEDHDLAASNPEVMKELQAKWDLWNKQNIAPLWGGGHDGDDDGGEPGESGKGKKKK